MSKKNTHININVSLDENKVAEKIEWSAPDGRVENKDAKAMFLSFWDSEKMETLKMDLWIKEMPVHEMKLFFYQNLVSLGETYYRSTNDEKNFTAIKEFSKKFAKEIDFKI
ncbi:MAG: gliding motility protein GldC [Bacteroidota bacterium]|nr:gliding motility protein GldC [Bacteroidota bacterium]